MSDHIEHLISLSYRHQVHFTRDLFTAENDTLTRVLTQSDSASTTTKVLLVCEDAVLRHHPALLQKAHDFFAQQLPHIALHVQTLAGGEACKNSWAPVEHLWQLIEHARIDRQSYVIAIGGGAFLDLVGLASATAHRGIRHIRVPTTTLSQGDGGVGVKNGVNYFQKKNWVGTFSVPYAVLVDFLFLRSLPAADQRAGLIEAVKVALLRDSAFFTWIEEHQSALTALEPTAVETAIRRSAELHLTHIATGGDPFELTSARPLDYGHWIAHKLEPLSHYRLRHGEAVAIGIVIDLLYTRRQGLMDAATCERIIQLIIALGFTLYVPELESPDLLQGLHDFREHLGGPLTITLVTAPGTSLEVHEIDHTAVQACLDEVRARFASTCLPGDHR
jgi:3-dehydroquinate synthase